MRTGFLRMFCFVVAVGVGVSASSLPVEARTTKRKPSRGKVTKRVVVSSVKTSLPANVEAVKAAVMAVFNRYVAIDIEAQQHPEAGADVYKEVSEGEALRQFVKINKSFLAEGSYCDCPASGLEVIDLRFDTVASKTVSLRYCERGTGPIRSRKDNSILPGYPPVTVSDRILWFRFDEAGKKWTIYDAAHFELNGRNSTCANAT